MIQIDGEFQSLIPPLTDDEYGRLEKSILAEGVREPIITWGGTIIDGHNRYRICQEHGIDCPHVEREFDSRDAAKIWIYGNQLGRRNLEAGQKAALVIERNEAKVREAARLRQVAGVSVTLGSTEPKVSNDRRDQQTQTEPEPEKGRTAEILAKQAGVGEATIKRVLKVKREDPELYDKVRSGKVSTHTAYKQVVDKEPQKHKPQQKRTAIRAQFTDDGRRICNICGEPINEGEHFTDKLNWHYKCGLERENENQRRYRDADHDLRENVATYTVELLLASLEMGAKDLHSSWMHTIKINEGMGAKLTAHEKLRIEEAANNLLTTIQTIRKERADEQAVDTI